MTHARSFFKCVKAFLDGAQKCTPSERDARAPRLPQVTCHAKIPAFNQGGRDGETTSHMLPPHDPPKPLRGLIDSPSSKHKGQALSLCTLISDLRSWRLYANDYKDYSA